MENIIKKLRGNLSQAELAKQAGVAQSAIATYELGRFPKPETLEKIAAAVGKRVKWIIEDLNEEEEKTVEGQEQVNRPRAGERRQTDRRDNK